MRPPRQVFQQAVEAYEAEGKPDMAAEMKANLGLVHRALGENQQALDVTMEALRVFESIKDARRQAMALGNLGGVYVELGDKEQAYNCYRRAADLFQTTLLAQLFHDRDVVNLLTAFVQARDRFPHPGVTHDEEVFCLQEGRDFVIGVGIDQDRAKHSLFGVHAVRSHLFGAKRCCFLTHLSGLW